MFKYCIVGKLTSYFCKKCKCGKCVYFDKCDCPRKNKNRK